MRMEEVNARKTYIQNVRKSFDSPNRNYEWEKEPITEGEAADGFSFFKVRLLIAVFIFIAYVLCDQTNTLFYQYSTKDVVEKIAQNYDYNEVKDEVMQVFHQTMEIR